MSSDQISKAKIIGLLAAAVEEFIETEAGLTLGSLELRVAFLSRGELRLTIQARRAGHSTIVNHQQIIDRLDLGVDGASVIRAAVVTLARETAVVLGR